MPQYFLVDIHGVLADFVKAFLDYHELYELYVNDYKNWPKGVYPIKQATGKAFETFPSAGFLSLPKTKEFDTILELLDGHFVAFASHCYRPDDMEPVQQWCANNIPYPHMLFITQAWKGLALPADVTARAILIDDCEDEVLAWPGRAILLPRPWNNATGTIESVLKRAIYGLEDGYNENIDRH